jgi:hypothetical protein
MSFRCGLCKRAMPNGSSPTIEVVETRRKVYPEQTDKSGKVRDRGGEGWEIVREIMVCKRCINLRTRQEREQELEL